jgi:hypothetical protein
LREREDLVLRGVQARNGEVPVGRRFGPLEGSEDGARDKVEGGR